jgi:hypothetical protein
MSIRRLILRLEGGDPEGWVILRLEKVDPRG